MLHAAGLPDRFWPFTCQAAVYVGNRLPSKATGNATPYQLWHGKRPHIGHIRAFSCLAYALVHGPSKLEDRATRCTFVGYPLDASRSAGTTTRKRLSQQGRQYEQGRQQQGRNGSAEHSSIALVTQASLLPSLLNHEPTSTRSTTRITTTVPTVPAATTTAIAVSECAAEPSTADCTETPARLPESGRQRLDSAGSTSHGRAAPFQQTTASWRTQPTAAFTLHSKPRTKTSR